jgi:hypothetical protein
MNPAIPLARAASRFQLLLTFPLVAALILHVPPTVRAQKKSTRQGPQNTTAHVASEPITFVRCTDDRILKMGTGKAQIRLNTPYGKLLIPMANIRSIEFATRIADADARRANAAVANLSSRQFRIRRAAEVELLKLRAKASPALHQALRSDDVEVVLRAKALLSRLSQFISEDQLEIRDHDLIRTADSQIAGRIDGTGLPLYPLPPDKEPRKLLPLMGLRSLAVGGDPRAINATPDPGNLQAFQERIGKTFWFKVTGTVGGPVWGTKVYTSDSNLAAAAVHAGILKAGQTGVVQVKVVAPPASYTGSTRNGVASAPYGAWPGAYEFVRRGG